MTDRYSGQSRGFGFIEMATDEEAQNAIRLLHGRNVSGREIVVNEARQRTESGGSRPGGGHRSPAGSSYGGGGGYNRGAGSGGSGGGGFNRGEGRRDRYDRDRY
jgi:RNA recognition motif-containing protein